MFNPDIGFCVAWLNVPVHILIFHFSGITWHIYPTQFISSAHWYMKNYYTTGIIITQVKYNSWTFIPLHWVFLTAVIYRYFKIVILKQVLTSNPSSASSRLWSILTVLILPFYFCFWICFCLIVKLLWIYLCFWSLIYFDNEARSVMNIFWIMLWRKFYAKSL